MAQEESIKGKVEMGTEVTITNSKFPGKKAKILFIGQIDDQKGEWVGVQLLGGEKGNHSGTLKGKTYFTTTVPDTGIFVKSKYISLPNQKKGTESNNSPQKPSGKGAETTGASKFAPVKKETKDDKGKPTLAPTKTATTKDKPDKPVENSAPKIPKKRQQLKTQLDNAEETERLQEIITALEKENKQLKQASINKIKQQNEGLMSRIKQVEQENHNLKMTVERASNQINTEKQSKLSELSNEIAFYKKSKDDNDKEKKKFETRISQLQAELDEHAQNQNLILKLNDKIEHLENKNQTMRTELEVTKTKLKNTESSGGSKSESDFNEEINILNETIILLESQAKEDKEKINLLTKEAEGNAVKIAQAKATEKKLKEKERQNSQLKESLEEQSDAINFVQQLSLTKLRIEEELKASKEKINDLLNEKDLVEQVQIEQEEMLRELEHQINQRDIQIQQVGQRVKDRDIEIGDKVKQINQYKDRISQLLKLAEQNNNLNKMRIQREATDQGEQSMTQSSIMQSSNHMMDVMKFAETINQKFIKHQNDNILVRNKAGVFLLNLFQALPAEFIQQFYPEAIDMLVSVKTTKDKTFYLFEWICSELREKNELYSDENIELTNWILSFLNRLQRTYYNLQRVDLLISNCETEEQLGNIIAHRGIRDQSVVLDDEITDLTNKFAENNISMSYSFDKIDHCNDKLESECAGFNKTMSKDNETKLELCRSIMENLHGVYTLILSYRVISELRENAQIDAGFDTCVKRLKDYLRQICLNNHFRYKPKMKNLIDDMSILKDTVKQIDADETIISHIENLGASESEIIKILKECILSSQAQTKELLADLKEIELTDELQKIQGRLEGNVWNTKLTSMKEELLKVRQLVEQKAALEFDLVEHKKKILIQEKEIKDKLVVKDVLEKRIAELILKSEQVTVLNNAKERLEAKLKSAEQNNKIMEEEIQNLIKKKSMIEEENKKIKEAPINDHGQRHHKISAKQMSLPFSISSVPVQSLLKENSNLRNADLKQKVSALRFSDVMKFKKDTPADPKKPIRKQFLQTIVNLKIVSPFDQKVSNPQLELQRLYLELDKINLKSEAKKETKLVEVGTVRVWGGSNEAAGNTISVLGYSEMKNVLPDLVRL